MKRKQSKTASLVLRKETLLQLKESDLKKVAAAARIWRPSGYAEDTTPLGEYVDVP
jgi:hypothetical protein